MFISLIHFHSSVYHSCFYIFCFISGCFIKPINMIINYFVISQAHSQRNFRFLISGISKGETGNGKELGMANSKFISKIISIF